MRVGRRVMRLVKWEDVEEGRSGEDGGRRRMVNEGGKKSDEDSEIGE